MSSLTKALRKLRKVIKKIDPLTDKLLKNTKDLPGTPGSLMEGLTGDYDSDPFSSGQSRMDVFAGGRKISSDPDARMIGRAVGSAFAGYYGAAAAGAGAGSASTAAAGAVQLAQGAEAANIAQELADEEAARQRELIAVMRGEQTEAPEEQAIPFADEAAQRRQRRRSIASMQRRRGRQSTILTGGGGGDRLGA